MYYYGYQNYAAGVIGILVLAVALTALLVVLVLPKEKDGHFYFADGTRARFIGFNLPTRSNTPDHETADKLAARFASLGVNVIRLHAADAPIGDVWPLPGVQSLGGDPHGLWRGGGGPGGGP